jgi:hypothetical protein
MRLKVGMSKVSMWERVMSLRLSGAAPGKVIVLRFFPTARPYEIEHEVHAHLAQHRAHGEWFDASLEQVDAAFAAEGIEPSYRATGGQVRYDET